MNIVERLRARKIVDARTGYMRDPTEEELEAANHIERLERQKKDLWWQRDKLWCEAIVATQDGSSGRLVCDVETLLRHFNKSKEDA